MSKDDEAEYVDYCAEAMFRIHMLELRLNRLINNSISHQNLFKNLIYLNFIIDTKKWHH